MKLYEITGYAFSFEKEENYPLIGKVSCEVKIGRIVEYKGNYYSVRVLDPNHNAAFVRKVKELNLDTDARTYAEPNITCPVCGYSDDASFELDDTNDHFKCACCGAILQYRREIFDPSDFADFTVEYSAKVVALPTVNK